MDTIEDRGLVPNLESADKKRTFADKFSKFKSRFMLIFWSLLIALISFYTYRFTSALYSITRSSESFYSIEVKDNKAYYTRVTVMPGDWVPLNKISKRLQQAIVSSEDGKFYEHPGYDSEQLHDAIHDSYVLKKKMRGASTITQQLMKNLYLTHHKSFGRKAQELVMALMVERYASKQKILEMYLNVIEYGEGLFGIGAASKYYFNKPAERLNAREAAFLAMLLPSPKKYAKSFKKKMLTPFADRMISSVLQRMKMAGHIGEEEYLAQLDNRFAWERAPVVTVDLDESSIAVDSIADDEESAVLEDEEE